MAETYFSGQGKVYIATRDANGNPGPFRDLGNVPALAIALGTDVLEHKESRTGSRLTDLRMVRDRTATVTMTLESFNTKNLAMILYGTVNASVAGGTVTNEISPAGLAVGDIVLLAKPPLNTGSVVVNTSPSGTLWVEGTDYSVDYNAGMITILSISKGTIIEVDYTYKVTDIVPIFKDTMQERYIRFVGVNTANANKAATVEMYRVVFDPASTINLINDEIAQFELTGSLLYDSTRDTNSLLGGFGKIVQEP